MLGLPHRSIQYYIIKIVIYYVTPLQLPHFNTSTASVLSTWFVGCRLVWGFGAVFPAWCRLVPGFAGSAKVYVSSPFPCLCRSVSSGVWFSSLYFLVRPVSSGVGFWRLVSFGLWVGGG